jgi:hypothetical protein
MYPLNLAILSALRAGGVGIAASRREMRIVSVNDR